MRQKFLAHFDEHTDDWVDGKVTAGMRRVLYATWLSESWREFFAEGGQEQVRHVQATPTTISDNAFYCAPAVLIRAFRIWLQNISPICNRFV
jgi:uncharacterized NAD(P)/FAD-binding protein YdhS